MKKTKILPSLIHQRSSAQLRSTQRDSLDQRNYLNDLQSASQGRIKIQQRSIMTDSSAQKKSLFQTNQNGIFEEDASILKEIDFKIERHQQDIESRNDIIQYIELGVNTIKTELIKEKNINNDQKQQISQQEKSISTFQHQNGILQTKIRASKTQIEDLQNKVLLQEKEKDQLKAESIQQLALHQKVEQQLKQINQDLIQKDKNIVKQEITKQKAGENDNNIQMIALNHQIHTQQVELEILKNQIQQNHLKLSQDEIEIKILQEQQMTNLKTFQVKESEFFKSIDRLEKKIQSQLDTLKEQEAIHSQYKTLQKKELDLTDQLKKEIVKLSLELQQQVESQNELKNQVEKLQKQKNKSQKLLENQREDQSKQIENLKSDTNAQNNQIAQLRDELSKLTQTLQDSLKQSQDQTLKIAQKQSVFLADSIITLEKSKTQMINNLQCTFCNAFVKKPVTVIPCGHSYCFDCKKGYTKECSKCGPKIKIEAVYRNELLDDIINMVKIIEGSIDMMKKF